MKKRVLILGASGFIGRNLFEQLSSKYTLLIPKHSELDLTDVQNTTSYFRNRKVDIVINAAVAGGSRKEEYEENALKTNLLMFFNIIRNKKYFKKLIHFGSGAEYDKSRPLLRVKEKNFDERIPVDDYGFFKYTCSKYFETLDNIVNLRIFGLFGKFEDYRYRFISNAICQNLLDLPITIKQNVIFDYVYIDDFVRIVDYFINHETKEKFYNIGSGTKIDLLTVAKKINKIAERKSKIIIKNEGFNNEYTCDNNRLMKELKQFKLTDFDEAIERLYIWYKNHIATLKYVNKI